ncbi:MAG: hypothetical protein IK081_03850 [Lachnospiraceae bacterium]|nr:hypothetical protein [Lachnospiraceae bacterium]
MSVKKLLKKAINKFQKITKLETFQDEEDESLSFQIIEKKNPLLPWRNCRMITFVRDNRPYVYSSVFLSKLRKLQPICPYAQTAFDDFLKGRDNVERTLVLGCAGCSIPRYFALRFKNAKITGIEYSELMIQIAQKYFIADPLFHNFDLIRDDAFAYVRKEDKAYQAIFVDVFVADQIHPQVFTEEFLTDLFRISAEESITVFNFLNVSMEKTAEFIRTLPKPFPAAYAYGKNGRIFVALIKTKDPSTLASFEKRLTKKLEIYDKYFS